MGVVSLLDDPISPPKGKQVHIPVPERAFEDKVATRVQQELADVGDRPGKSSLFFLTAESGAKSQDGALLRCDPGIRLSGDRVGELGKPLPLFGQSGPVPCRRPLKRRGT
jgi:hypothetical protein